MKPALVVMAAGLASRFGAVKQLSPVGPCGEHLMDYSIYDAIGAGFGKLVFVIKREQEHHFRQALGHKLERVADVRYAHQELEDILPGFAVPQGRTKPWGTAHAVYSARHVVSEPFAVINADDFYGARSFVALAAFLAKEAEAQNHHVYALVGFGLANTLSKGGSVSRGVCRLAEDGWLAGLTEHTQICEKGGRPCYTEDGEHYVPLCANAVVSMNMWGFTPDVFLGIAEGLAGFMGQEAHKLLSAEFYLPSLVDALVQQGAAKVRVLTTSERWFGLTHPEDLEWVRLAIAAKVQAGQYPQRLW
jgi:hypothetical protein